MHTHTHTHTLKHFHTQIHKQLSLQTLMYGIPSTQGLHPHKQTTSYRWEIYQTIHGCMVELTNEPNDYLFGCYTWQSSKSSLP